MTKPHAVRPSLQRAPLPVWMADDVGVGIPELLVALSIVLILGGVGIALVRSTIDEARTWGAAHHMSARLSLARMEAVKRSRAVALRFESGIPDFRYRFYVDGNGNGIRTADINLGIDTPLLFQERLRDLFPGVNFEIGPNLAPLDPGQPLVPGSDPIRIGAARIWTFTARGTATAGTVYLRGRSGQQFAVRVLGATGRTRILKFDRGTQIWVGS